MLSPRFTNLVQHSLKTQGYHQNTTFKSGGSLPRYFHTVYPIKSKPSAFYSSYWMSQSSSQHQPTISDCYYELMVDPSLLQSFSEDEWMSILGLPYLHIIHWVKEAFHPTSLLSTVEKHQG